MISQTQGIQAVPRDDMTYLQIREVVNRDVYLPVLPDPTAGVEEEKSHS